MNVPELDQTIRMINYFNLMGVKYRVAKTNGLAPGICLVGESSNGMVILSFSNSDIVLNVMEGNNVKNMIMNPNTESILSFFGAEIIEVI